MHHLYFFCCEILFISIKVESLNSPQVTEEDTLTELTAPVAGIILTLMTNLRQCFCPDPVTEDEASQVLTLLDSTGGLGQSAAWGQKAGSRTQFASSLQLVLRGVIDHILLSSKWDVIYILYLRKRTESERKKKVWIKAVLSYECDGFQSKKNVLYI